MAICDKEQDFCTPIIGAWTEARSKAAGRDENCCCTLADSEDHCSLGFIARSIASRREDSFCCGAIEGTDCDDDVDDDDVDDDVDDEDDGDDDEEGGGRRRRRILCTKNITTPI